jgi:hypothetical protein
MTAKAFIEAVQEAATLSYSQFAERLGMSQNDRRCENLFFSARDLAKLCGEFKDNELACVLRLEA